jgi:DNA-binding GntR family transcriptional regulator
MRRLVPSTPTLVPPPPSGDRVTRSSLADEVAGRLQQRIVARHLPPGHRVDELRLAAELGVSRTPVREALKILAMQGLVTLVPRRGAVITMLSEKDVRDVLSVLMILEGDCAGDVARSASAADVKRLRQIHDKMEAAAAAGRRPRYVELNRDFHAALQDIADNRWRRDIVTGLLRVKDQFPRRSLDLPGRVERSIEEHRALLEAIEARDGDAASRLMQKHVENQWLALIANLPSADSPL